jgi:serine/threonine-protein kinase
MSPTVADFVSLLTQANVLEANQLRQLTSEQHRYANLPDLTRDLLRRGWLTSYQVERLNREEFNSLVMGPYILLEELGQGGMGRVYKARHRHLERIVALKVIHSSDLNNPESVGRFRREAKAIARLRHPNIVLLYDADVIDGLHFLALEYVRGIDLHRLVVRQGPLDVAAACDYVRQAALGLQQAHERGLVHRDVKPANLLLTRAEGDDPVADDEAPAGGLIKILDMGLARFANSAEGDKLSLDGFIVGTPDYLAPEQALDSSKVDPRADIYSLGCTFYELLAGQTPFAAFTGTQKLMAHIQEEPPALRSLRPDLDPRVIQVVARMMAKQPGERYPTAGQVAAVLEGLPAKADCPARAVSESFAEAPAALDDTPTGRICFRGPQVPEETLSSFFADSPRELPESHGPVLCAAISPDGRYALTGGEKAALCLWDLGTCGRVRRFTGHSDAVSAVAFSPDRRYAVSAGRDRAVYLWDVETGQPLSRLRGIVSPVTALAFAPDGQSFLTGDEDATLTLWERQTSKRALQLGGLVRRRHFGAITSALFTRDGSRIISTSRDGTVRLWNVRGGGELHCFPSQNEPVHSVALSPDGLHMLTGGADKVVRYWGIVSGEELSRGVGHGSAIKGVAFMPDSRQALSADDRTLRLWDLESGRELFCSPEDLQQILCMAVSPDGRQVLTGGRDKFLCLWTRND